jgi:hypothetical protein
MSKVLWPTFILSSSHAAWLVGPTKHRKIHEGFGLYYGLTWDSSNIYVGYRGTQATAPTDRVQRIAVLDKEYNQKKLVPGVFLAIHQILYTRGKLYVTATSIDAVYSVDLLNGHRETHDWVGHGTDIHHINSLFDDGNHFWVCYHNLDGRSTMEKKSQMVKLIPSLSVVEELHNLGKSSHNIYVDSKYVYTCNSNAGSLMRKNRRTGELESAAVGGWARGLAVTDDFILVGSSTRGAPGLRDLGSLTVHMLDRETLQLIDERLFPGFGGVYDLRIVSQPDHAHNALPFPGSLNV